MGRIVIAAYRPKAGQSAALKRLVAGHVPRLRALGLVTQREPIAMQAQDGTLLEVFEWESAAAIEAAHTHPEVLKMWREFGALCEYLPIGGLAEAANVFSEFTPLQLREGA